MGLFYVYVYVYPRDECSLSETIRSIIEGARARGYKNIAMTTMGASQKRRRNDARTGRFIHSFIHSFITCKARSMEERWWYWYWY